MLTLESIKHGAALEQFNYELSRIAENALDPNTDATRQRKVTLVVKVKPDKDREVGKLEFSINPDFAPQSSVETTISFGHDEDGVATMSEFGAIDPNRATLPGTVTDNKSAAAGDTEDDEGTETHNNKVTPMQRAGGM